MFNAIRNLFRAPEPDPILVKYRQAALDFVNDMRRDFGLEPVDALSPGYMGKAASCPIARSLRHGHESEVDSHAYHNATLHWIDHRVPHLTKHLPADAFSFVQSFDSMTYPDLVMKP